MVQLVLRIIFFLTVLQSCDRFSLTDKKVNEEKDIAEDAEDVENVADSKVESDTQPFRLPHRQCLPPTCAEVME